MNRRNPKAYLRSAAMVPEITETGLRDQAVAYYRVSTTEQANTSYDDDGFSIQAQSEYCERKAREMDVDLVKEYVDQGKSARTTDRPALQAMLRRIAIDPDIRYVIVHKLDRLARNREDDVQINMTLAKHRARLVSATENIDESPGGKLVHGIMASIAEWYSGNLSEEAHKGLRKKVEIGGTPTRAALGYLNVRDKRKGKDVGIVVVDDVRGPIMTDAFRLYATGQYTLSTLTDELNHRGLTLPEDRRLPERPVRPQTIHRLLRNRYYLGVVTYHGVEYPGEHDALIDQDTFDTVQAILTARNLNKDKSQQHPHPLKGNLYCASCGRRLGITSPTNRHGTSYSYFYCLGRQVDKASCQQKYIAVERVEKAVADYFRRVRLPADRLQRLRDEIAESFVGKHEEGRAEIKRLQARIQQLQQRAQKNKEAYFADALSLEDFKLEQDKTGAEVVAAERTIARLTVTLESIQQSLDEALSLLVDPYRLFVQAPEAIQLMLTQAIFDKLWIMDAEVVGAELTMPYHELLTVEARLAKEALRTRIDEDQIAVSPQQRRYHRRVGNLGEDGAEGDSALDDWSVDERLALFERLWIERPRGALPLEMKNPALVLQERGSNLHHLVGVGGLELHRWEIAKRAVQPGFVEPLHPVRGGQFKVVDAAPGATHSVLYRPTTVSARALMLL